MTQIASTRWILSGKATYTNCIDLGLNRLGPELTIYPTQCQHANHYTIDEVGICVIMKQNERYAGHRFF